MKKLDDRTEAGIQILEALDDANFAKIDEIVNSGIRNLSEIVDDYNWNWLHLSLKGFDKDKPPKESVVYLINNGNDVSLKDCYDMTPLHYAMRAQNVEAAKVLLEAGADPNIANEKKITPLAYINGMPEELELLKLMLDKGGDVNFNNGHHGILEGIKKYRAKDDVFLPVIEMMEKYVSV